MKELTITLKEENQRLDKYLAKYLNKAPKSFIYRMLRKKNIKLNKKKAEGNEKLKNGDLVQLFLSDETIAEFRQVAVTKVDTGRLHIVYEDDNLLLCNKPINMLTQKDQQQSISIIDMATTYLMDKGDYVPSRDFGFKPGVCNRLDRNTSGLVMVGKNLGALQELNQAIKEQRVQKYYMTLVQGQLKKAVTLDNYLIKDRTTNTVRIVQRQCAGSVAVKTVVKPMKHFGDSTLCHIQLITGKSHQIRAHLNSIGHPVLGDPKYGDPELNAVLKREVGIKSQLLHAYKLSFSNMDGQLAYLNDQSFAAKEPAVYKKAIRFIESR